MQIQPSRRAMGLRYLRIVLGLALLYGMGLGVRRVIVDAQYDKLGSDFPFTLESALHYRRVKMVYDTGTMPVRDPMVGAPEGVEVRKTYEFGTERVQAALARLLPKHLSVGDRLRWVEAGWFCLGIPLLCLWVWRASGQWQAGAFAAALYAVSIAAVSRSTGHELSKENFALPLFIAHLAAGAFYSRSSGRMRYAWAALSGGLLGGAMASWDMIQFAVLASLLYSLYRAARDRWTADEKTLWLFHAGGLVLAGSLSPYLRAHGFLTSPVGLLMGITAIAGWGHPLLPADLRGRVRPWAVVAGLILLGVALFALTPYGASYHHFTDLLWAKLRHGNVKPSDPALLSFEQRIMWVPALHSATWQLTASLFPALLAYSLIALTALCFARRYVFPVCSYPAYLFIASLLAFILFARFQVYLSLFAAALCGFTAARIMHGALWRTFAVWIAVALVWLIEIAQSVREPERWGRTSVYYPELVELTRWLREHAAPDTVLAGFGVSGSIAAYGKCAVVLHPKFEDPLIRDRVRTYAEHLFKGTELSLRDWADQMGADYLVYAKGEFSSVSPELQMRYMVDALSPSTNCPAYRFEFQPLNTKWFHYRWSNRKYVAYKILTRADEFAAAQHGRRARAFYHEQKWDEAERAAVESLTLNPDETIAQEVLRLIGLRRAPASGSGAAGRKGTP